MIGNALLSLTILLAVASPVSQQVMTPMQDYEVAIQCSAVHALSSVLSGQMGNADRESEMDQTAGAFETIAVRLGAPLGIDRDHVSLAVLERTDGITASLRFLDSDADVETAIADWVERLNHQVDECAAVIDRMQGQASHPRDRGPDTLTTTGS